MNKRNHVGPLLAIGILMALVAPVAAQDWSGSGRVRGTVTDLDGAPVKDAKVYFREALEKDQGPDPFVTDKEGKFSFLGLRGGPWIVRVEAAVAFWSRHRESAGQSDTI